MELSEIRAKIDAVDDDLLRLFLERMALSDEIAAYKNEHHLPILNRQREREILARVTESAGEGGLAFDLVGGVRGTCNGISSCNNTL